jgi:NAD(P)-dependent dehydrogenase (short-subunit alcohol dehydrogenase family)
MSTHTSLIVGGSSGIGLATARQLAERGAAVHVVGRSRDRLDEIASTDPSLIGHQADGSDAEAMRLVLDSIGTIDWLIVTLSGGGGQGPLANLDLTELRGAFDAKFWAHMTTIQVALAHLAPRGSITLVGAVSARMGMPGTAGLAAINGAVEAVVKPLAVELAPIRVNAVSPGLVDTPWWNGLPAADREAYFAGAAKALPSGHVATAAEIAEVVVLAATNTNTTGTVIETDGGARLVTMG